MRMIVLGAGTPVVCLQNGVANEPTALRWFAHVYGVVVMVPATHLEPGVVAQHSSPVPGLLDVGRFPVGGDELCGRLVDALRSAGFDARVLEDVMRWKYGLLQQLAREHARDRQHPGSLAAEDLLAELERRP